MEDEKDPFLILSEPCSVTAFGMELQLSKDGRERGLWFFLNDDSELLRETSERWLDAAIDLILNRLDVPAEEKGRTSFSLAMALRGHAMPHLRSKVREAALIEWSELEKIYKAIGKQLAYARAKKLL